MALPERVKNKMKDVGLREVNKAQRLPASDTSGKSHHVMASEGGKYKSETDWNKDKKRFDDFLDFCLLMAKEVSDNNKPRFSIKPII